MTRRDRIIDTRNATLFEHALTSPLEGHELGDMEAFVASLLLTATDREPITNDNLRISIGLRFNTRVSERTVKQVIETLQWEHRFPIVGSKGRAATKTAPAQKPGYFWASKPEQLIYWYRRVRRESTKQLGKIEGIMRSNWPAMMGQMRLEEAEDGDQKSEVRSQRSEVCVVR